MAQYNFGDRVRMVGVMPGDPNPVEVGAEGTVQGMRGTGHYAQIEVLWDNGRQLMLLPGDPFIVTGKMAGVK